MDDFSDDYENETINDVIPNNVEDDFLPGFDDDELSDDAFPGVDDFEEEDTLPGFDDLDDDTESEIQSEIDEIEEDEFDDSQEEISDNTDDFELEEADDSEYEEVEADDESEYEEVEADNDLEYEEIEADDNSEYEEVEADDDSEYEEVEVDDDSEYEEVEVDDDSEYEEVEADDDSEYEEVEVDDDSEYEEVEADDDSEYEEVETDDDSEYEEVEVDDDSEYEEVEADDDSEYEEVEADDDSEYEEVEIDDSSELEEVDDDSEYEEEYTDEVELPDLDDLDDLDNFDDGSDDLGDDFDDSLPGMDDDFDDDSSFDVEDDSQDDLLVNFNEEDEPEPVAKPNKAGEIDKIKPKVDYSMSSLNSLLTKDKKIATFIGTTKNGTSFLINNLAALFSSLGINTAILDMTKNKNSYYIYTNNQEELRNIAFNSISKLQKGFAEGIKVDKNLSVYTALPNDGKDYSDAEPILSTLVQHHSLILIDCDYDTDPSYFACCQEIYLVQSMDILTIQPLTAFLRDLKTQGVLESEKVRVVINKELEVKNLTTKVIIGGMSFYNDPSMSFMTELFNKDMVKACSIPFDEKAYSKYLYSMAECNVSINGYSKQFLSKLKNLGDMVYPLVGKSRQQADYGKNSFSNNMNDTLNQMKNKY